MFIVSPNLIFPSCKDIDVSILRGRINQLPREFLRHKHLIKDFRSAFINKDEFWRQSLRTISVLKPSILAKKVDKKTKMKSRSNGRLYGVA